MKILIIYSTATGNTRKLVNGIRKKICCKVINPSKKAVNETKKADLVVFASGIYAWRHHKALLNFAESLPKMNKKCLIISTAGSPALRGMTHFALRRRLKNKMKILGEFSCRGFDNFGPLKLVGGLNKGRPNQKDINNAVKFIREIKCQ